MASRRKQLEKSRSVVVRTNPGGGDCLLHVGGQMREELSKCQQILFHDINPGSRPDEIPAVLLLREREALLQVTRTLHKSYMATCSLNMNEKRTLIKSLNAQVRARKCSGVFLGTYIQDGVPTDFDALASTLSIQFNQHWLVTNKTGEDIPIWTTQHGNSTDPEAPFALLFTETIGVEAGHFELLSLRRKSQQN